MSISKTGLRRPETCLLSVYKPIFRSYLKEYTYFYTCVCFGLPRRLWVSGARNKGGDPLIKCGCLDRVEGRRDLYSCLPLCPEEPLSLRVHKEYIRVNVTVYKCIFTDRKTLDGRNGSP